MLGLKPDQNMLVISIKSKYSKIQNKLLSSGAKRTKLQTIVFAAATDRPWAQKTGKLVLEDGSVFKGVGFGAKGTQVGEVVFNTSLTGYQEVMTDPSYRGQFVCFTQPQIGNTGINIDDVESTQCHLGAILIRDLSKITSNYRSSQSLSDYCTDQKVIGLAGIDTRALTRKLRDVGCLNGVVSTDDVSDEELVAQAKEWSIVGKDLLKVVTCNEQYKWNERFWGEWEFNQNAEKYQGEKAFKVIAYDFGIKHNILRRLASFNCDITVVPASTPAADVLASAPEGVFFSNGPGDPSAAPYAVENAHEIIGKVPVFGICMGHQLIGQAFGAKTFKMKFGHHGSNHPIKHVPTGRIEISSQNHNFAVDPSGLPYDVAVTHVNLNDGTCAGLVSQQRQVMTIQYHPEASPGPHDADVCFEQFVQMMRENRK